MGCNSSYMEATQAEKNLSVVYGLLDEIKTGKLPNDFGNGYDYRVYGTTTKKRLDEKTEELCFALQILDQHQDVSKYSLEMQIWWRDHQKADKERIEKEMEELKEKEAKELAVAKLTPYERKLLGL
jgi:vacuolar-type H+-ATPase subunit I/STV1